MNKKQTITLIICIKFNCTCKRVETVSKASFNFCSFFFSFFAILLEYSNSTEFKGKLEIGNNSAAEFDAKFINIAELLTKSYKSL
jgi:hypothetical protein